MVSQSVETLLGLVSKPPNAPVPEFGDSFQDELRRRTGRPWRNQDHEEREADRVGEARWTPDPPRRE